MLSLLIIYSNCLTFIIQISENVDYKNYEIFAKMADKFFFYFYLIEMLLKMFALGLFFNENSYFKDPWNILDFFVNLFLILPNFFKGNSVDLSSFRSMRILKVLKSIRYLRKLRIILIALFESFPSLIRSLLILNSFYIVYAIIGLHIFSGTLKFRCIKKEFGITHPEEYICGNFQCPINYICAKLLDNPNGGLRNFDTFFYSFVQVFQLATLEDWTIIMYDIIRSNSLVASIYFISFILIGSYFLLNLMLVVIKVKFTETHSFLVLEKQKDIYFEEKSHFDFQKSIKEGFWTKKSEKNLKNSFFGNFNNQKKKTFRIKKKIQKFKLTKSVTDKEIINKARNNRIRKFTVLLKPNAYEESIGDSNISSYEINDLNYFHKTFPKKIRITKKSHRKLNLRQFFSLSSNWIKNNKNKVIPQFLKIRIQNQKKYESTSTYDVILL